ncbi:MAG: hypothetical protein Q4G65_11185 [bacterium]|nr:hypothetical protein [bacterium]
MRKIGKENLEIMAANLAEAAGDLRELEARLDYAVNGQMPKGWEGCARIWRRVPLCASALHVIFEHVYHHINFAWNSRFASAARVVACAKRDYERWMKFPEDFPSLQVSREVKPIRSVADGQLNFFHLRMNIRESMMFLGGVTRGIEKAIGAHLEIGDADLAWNMELLLGQLNVAWHCRRYDINRSIELGCRMRNLKRWRKFPREFTRLMRCG